MKRFSATLTGTAPLLMHNERLADPTSKYAKGMKALTGKRKKTDEDHAEIKRAEWWGGLYTNAEENEVVVPVDWILAMALAGAKKSKDGPKVKSGVFEVTPEFPLAYEGKRELGKLFDDGRFVDYRGVGVNGKRVMRCRPRFPNWELKIELDYDENVLDARELRQFVAVAGQLIGIGDYRPRFGRFTVSQ
jgi:hypothetical protein